MNETNGPVTDRILSLDAARAPRLRSGDLITVKQARGLVIEECTKVHEYYLEQIPNFVGRMIQVALLHYGLIKPIEPVDIQPPATAEPTEPTAIPEPVA